MTRRAGWLAPALVLTLVFSGCSQADSDLAAESAGELQSLVVSVAETAATGDYAGALADLDALQVALDTARGQGDVSDERAATIQSAIDEVRADLVQAAESATPSSPAEAPDSVAPEVPDVPLPEQGGEEGSGDEGNRGNGNDGNSGNSGNGNGNRGGRGNG